jgi:hypothetical protein
MTMMNAIFFLIGVAFGGIGAVIYYRRNIVTVEIALAEAVRIRKSLEATLKDMQNKYGSG